MDDVNKKMFGLFENFTMRIMRIMRIDVSKLKCH